MKNFFKKLFGSNQVINFKRTTKTVVQVFDSEDEGPKRRKLFCGFIYNVDFNTRLLHVDTDDSIREIKFDNIVSMSRMGDRRIRIWIKTKEVAE